MEMDVVSMDTNSTRQPVLFLGHGSPLNALEDTPWARAWTRLGLELERPKAIVVVSAHWWTQGTLVTASPHPTTIHDFGGFPKALFDVEYAAPGDPELAHRIATRIDGKTTLDWGLDHGAWSLLLRLFPNADVPVVQVSLDATATPAQFLELGQNLSEFRREGVLLVFSGNITHNLPQAFRQMQRQDPTTPDWASDFQGRTMLALKSRDATTLSGLHATQTGRLSHPTPDHWFPLVVAYGATLAEEPMDYVCDGWDMGNLSMTSLRWG
jgi:4,5-DOPA dioxygenase extradiol